MQEPAGWQGKYSLWAARDCFWTTESLPRDVNHCLSWDHLHQTSHHPFLQRAVLKDNGRKDYKQLENAGRWMTIKKVGRAEDGFMFWNVGVHSRLIGWVRNFTLDAVKQMFFLDTSHNKAFWPVLLFLKTTNVTYCRNYGIWVSELAWSAPSQISGDLTICIFCLWNSFNLTGALFSKMKLRSFIDGLRCILCNFWMTDRCPVHWSQ